MPKPSWDTGTDSNRNSGNNSSNKNKTSSNSYQKNQLYSQIQALQAEKKDKQEEFDKYSKASGDISHAIDSLNKLDSDLRLVKYDVKTSFNIGSGSGFSGELEEQYNNINNVKNKLSASVLPNIKGHQKTLSTEIGNIDSRIKSLQNQYYSL